MRASPFSIFFFFNDTATTEIYTLSLHDALPISIVPSKGLTEGPAAAALPTSLPTAGTLAAVFAAHLAFNSRGTDRKSTRLNSSHSQISYAVFCLKKKKNNEYDRRISNI